MNIGDFEAEVELGYVRKTENNDLVLYTYNEACEHERRWNSTTSAARGIIFEKSTGKLIAKGYDKFHNLGSHPDTYLDSLPNVPYVVTEKMDGSYGTIYHYNNNWHVATKGSLSSSQALEAEKIIIELYDLSTVPHHYTLICEIIFPENRIVVNYGKERKLVLLAAFNRITNEELNRGLLKTISYITGIPLVRTYDYTISQMIELQKTLTKDEEGFVIRYETGLRVKIKGVEYLKIHKILANMTPLAFWEAMEQGEVPEKYLQQIPEELRELADSIRLPLERNYSDVAMEIIRDIKILPSVSLNERKTIGLFTQNPNSGLKHPGVIFPVLLQQTDTIIKYIMKKIRPDNNILDL